MQLRISLQIVLQDRENVDVYKRQDINTKDCMMLRAHQSLSNKELSLRNKTMVDFYISVIKRYRKELLKLSTLIVADAYFSTSTFVNGIKKEGFSLISRFRDNACLFYVYAGPRTGKRGRPKTKDGKIDMKNLDLMRTSSPCVPLSS